MNVEEIRSLLAPHGRHLADEYGVSSLSLFGSTVRGDATAASDIDMLVEFNRPTGYLGLVALQEHLEVLLGREVDLGTLRALKPRIRAHVRQEMARVL
jgi:predicted nucleotidyltransferase